MRLVPIVRRLSRALTGLTAVCLLAAPVLLAGPPQRSPVGLEDLWAPGWILRDTNRDGHVDDVEAGVRVASARPVAGAVAVNLAHRMGFETMSLDLPLAGSRLTFVVDERPEPGTLALLGAGLPHPGRGLVYLDMEADEPRLLLWGDDDGLAAAGQVIAGRLPALAAPDGLSLAEAVDGLVSGLRALEVPVRHATAIGLTVRTDMIGLESLLVRLWIDSTDGAPDLAALELTPLVPEGIGEVRLWFGPGQGPAHVVAASASSSLAEPPGRPTGGGRRQFSLAQMYEPGGFLGDADGDRVPDRTDVLLSVAGDPPPSLIDLGARLGVEGAGIRLPLAIVPADANLSGPLPLLVGDDHPAVQSMTQEGRLAAGPVAGRGRLEVVPRSYDDENVALVARGDPVGLDALLAWTARVAPNLASPGLDRPRLADVEHDLWRFLTQRSPAGQAVGALYALEQLRAEVPPDATDLVVEVAAEGASPGLEAAIRRRFDDPRMVVTVENLDVREASTILDVEHALVGEVGRLESGIEVGVVPRVNPGSRVQIEARISEPRPVREGLRQTIVDRLRGLGADAVVTVLPAYKQGFGWLEEVVLPRMVDRGVTAVEIRYATYRPPADWPGQAMGTPTRWLLELFPIDEIIARELDLPVEAVKFRAVTPDGPVYEVIARNAEGTEVLRDTFSPATVVRPYFDIYPRYERVRVTTGWLRAAVDGATVVDERIVTDLEEVWDLYQADVLTTLHDTVLRVSEGRPRADLAPHFGELRIEVEASEPERALGIDQERIAPIESLHEELYFGTLHFMDLLGRVSAGSPLSYPGRVIPVVRPLDDGRPGRVRFHLTGFSHPGPRVEVRFRSGGAEHVLRRSLEELDADPPTTVAVEVDAEEEGLAALELYMAVDSHEDPRTDLIRRTSARRVDSTWRSGARFGRLLTLLRELRDDGAYPQELSYRGLGELRLLTSIGHGMELRTASKAVLPAGGDPAPYPDASRLLDSTPRPGTRLVQWETPIPPAEAHRIVATLAAEFDAASAHRVGRSYLGQEIWTLELIAPLPGRYWSRAKLAEIKPTVVYSARQHANEVSSTSHVLRFAEELLTDPEQQAALDRVNVVIHPVTNPDGAQLAYDLWQITPDHMLHAGYLGALGVDVTAGAGSDDPIYPESGVRDRLWESWRPDIFLNPHGYPSHEWVQLFSEYAGWVRHRTTESRDWWGMRGWFMPGFSYLDDPDYPRHRDEAFRIRDYITRAINDVEPVADLNRRAYARYRRYGVDADPERFRMDLADGVLIYTSIKGSRAGGRGWVERNPKVTIWSGSTEAPDETAHGDWLELVASAGLAWDRAILAYLLETEHEVERHHEVVPGGHRLWLHRERPGRPSAEEGGAEQP